MKMIRHYNIEDNDVCVYGGTNRTECGGAFLTGYAHCSNHYERGRCRLENHIGNIPETEDARRRMTAFKFIFGEEAQRMIAGSPEARAIACVGILRTQFGDD